MKKETKADDIVTGAESVGTTATLPDQEKVRPWEKMPRKVWELLEDMDDDPDTRTEMTMAAVRYLFTGDAEAGFKGTKRLVYKSICLDIDMLKDVTKKRENAGRKGGKFHKRKAKTDLVKQNDDLLENEETKEEDALARKRDKSKEIRDKNGTKVPIDGTNVPLQQQHQQQNIREEKDRKICVWVMDMWNKAKSEVPRCKVKSVKVIDGVRIELCKEMWKALPSEKAIEQAFRNVMSSAFCNGETASRKKPVEFNWVIKAENIIRAYEGNL